MDKITLQEFIIKIKEIENKYNDETDISIQYLLMLSYQKLLEEEMEETKILCEDLQKQFLNNYIKGDHDGK